MSAKALVRDAKVQAAKVLLEAGYPEEDVLDTGFDDAEVRAHIEAHGHSAVPVDPEPIAEASQGRSFSLKRSLSSSNRVYPFFASA